MPGAGNLDTPLFFRLRDFLCRTSEMSLRPTVRLQNVALALCVIRFSVEQCV